MRFSPGAGGSAWTRPFSFIATLGIADRAAQLRADYGLRTPDAVQAASALALPATGFISNDPAFKRIKELDVVILDDLLRKV